MLAAQMPTQEKIEKSGTVFWNEGSLDMLRSQVKYFFDSELAKVAEVVNQRAKLVNMNELRIMPLNELRKLAEENIKKGVIGKTRQELTMELCRTFARLGNQVQVQGVLDFTKEGNVLLRDENRSYRHEIDDIAVPNELIKRYGLRPGNKVMLRLSQDQSAKANKPLRAGDVLEIEGTLAAEYTAPKEFDKLTPLFPRERIILENAELKLPSMRVLDLITPVGMGQRALVVAPPRGGKTVLLKSMAKSIRANYPDAELLILLLDERPEEVTDFEETVDAPVLASTFDESSRRHAQLSDLVLERARRLVEQGKNVIIMLDSLTRLARGYNANQTGGRIMSGGLGSNALEKPRKFFGAARNVEEGGSLTIIATCLVDTESRMDEIIFEEFKGTGNMEIRLDRELAERRMYPAISVPQSGTRNDDRLYHPDEFSRILQLRRQLASHPGWEALELLLKNIRRTQNNAELLISGLIDKK
ncbi:MAG: transcription termination factor Rho [Akkermansia sp.]|nr:transcription termination factor Rho [Akkermansia sp.]